MSGEESQNYHKNRWRIPKNRSVREFPSEAISIYFGFVVGGGGEGGNYEIIQNDPHDSQGI